MYRVFKLGGGHETRLSHRKREELGRSLVDQSSVIVSCAMDIKENLGNFNRKGKENFKRYNCDIENTTFKNKSRKIEEQDMLKNVWLWLDGLKPADCCTSFMEAKQLPCKATNQDQPASIKVNKELTEEAYNYWLSDNNSLEDSPELSFFGNLFKSLFLLGSSNQSLLDEILSSNNVNMEGVINSTPGVKPQKHGDSNLNASWLVSVILISDLYFCLDT